MGCVDDQLEVRAFGGIFAAGVLGAVQGGLVEKPLRGGVQQGDERFGHNFAIEPEMDSGDGSGFEHGATAKGGVFAYCLIEQQISHGSMGDGHDESVGTLIAAVTKFHGRDGAIVNSELPCPGTAAYFPTLV